MKIRITSDSTCDLSPELIEKYNIAISPLEVIKAGEPKLDGIEITPQDIFDHMEQTGTPCTTSAVSVSRYLDFFGELKKDCDAIIHFCISSSMSCCYQNAVIAAQELGGIYPVDSANLSTGIGHLVLDAAIMAEEGKTAEEIVAELNRLIRLVDSSFVVDTLTYLVKGGRCSALAAFGANMLSLKPCIEVKDGAMGVGKKYRGSIAKCLAKYVEERLSGNDNVDDRRVFITDSGISDEIYDLVLAKVREFGNFKEIIHTRAGCTVSSHCGPGTLGIIYYRKH